MPGRSRSASERKRPTSALRYRHQLAIAHVGLGKGGDPRPVEGAAHAGHRHIELVGGEIGEHRTESHLHILDLDAERGAERVEKINVEPHEVAARTRHAEHWRVHRGADPQHATRDDTLQAIGCLRRHRGGQREEGEGDDQNSEFHDDAIPVSEGSGGSQGSDLPRGSSDSERVTSLDDYTAEMQPKGKAAA